jgi:hypothetical protein
MDGENRKHTEETFLGKISTWKSMIEPVGVGGKEQADCVPLIKECRTT